MTGDLARDEWLRSGEPTEAEKEAAHRHALIAASEAARSVGRRSFTPLSALSRGSEDEFFSAASPNHPSPEVTNLASSDNTLQSSDYLQSSETLDVQSSDTLDFESSEKPNPPSPKKRGPPPVFKLIPQKRRRNSDSALKETPVAKEKFLAQATFLGSSASAAFIFGSCIGGAPHRFTFRSREEDRKQVEVKGDCRNPDESNPGEANFDGDIDGEPFEESTDDE